MYKIFNKLFGRTEKNPEISFKNNDDLVRLAKYAKGKKNLKIHLGCGPRILKNWINIDISFEPYKNYLKYYTSKFYGKEVRGKKSEFFAINIIKQQLPIGANTVAVVFHEDFIEHLDQKEQYLLLAETHRILKKGGVHRINTPEITSSMKLHSNFKLGFLGVYQEEWDKHIHKNILSVNTISEMARIVGYKKVIMQKRDQSAGNIPNEYRPDPHDRPESGNMYIDLIK